MKKIVFSIFLLLNIELFGVDTQVIHSSLSLYFEDKDFSASKQKNDGVVYGIKGDIHHKGSMYRLAYEKSLTDTKQPPLVKDLSVEKFYFRYAYALSKSFELNLNYIEVLHDNIVPTDGAKAYGIGFSYALKQNFNINYNQYYVDYNLFKVYESDIGFNYRFKYKSIKSKLSLVDKYINLKDKDSSSFSKNAKSSYNTLGIKLHSHYKSYHLGVGAYFGKRVFAIMNDGFKIQHHAMEFSKTYSIGIGKSFSNFIVRFQHIYQEATELPILNKDVKVSNNRIIINYKF